MKQIVVPFNFAVGYVHAIYEIKKIKFVHLPIAPFVLLSLSIPNAMLGKTQAKYRNSVVDINFCGVLYPIIPEIIHFKKS